MDAAFITTTHGVWVEKGQGIPGRLTIQTPGLLPIRSSGSRTTIEELITVFVGSWHAQPHIHCEIRSATLAFDQPMNGLWARDHFGVVVDLELGGETP